MPDAHYIHTRLAQIYDLTSGWSEDRDFYLGLADHTGMRILDLGCGTGLLTRAYAEKGCRVTGVDPAAAMLEVAKRLPFGEKIEWVQSDAQSYRSGKLFDLIIMTGNAFQVFLEDEDVLAVLNTMRVHLATGGKVVFETRNPAIRWEDRWNTESMVEAGEHKHKEVRNVTSRTSHLIQFETHYVFPDETLISKSTLRFHTVEGLSDLVRQAGLHVEKVNGDWKGAKFDPETTEEMVFTLTLPAH